MKRFLLMLLVFLGASVVWVHSAAPAHALGSGISAPLQTFINGRPAACNNSGDANGALLGTIVPCLANTIEDATQRMARGFSNMMRPIFAAFLTLVVVFFGVKILQGEGEVHKRFLMLLLKVGFVLMFLNNFAGLSPAVFAAIKEGQGIVTSAIAPSLSASKQIGIVTVNVNVASNNIHCDVSKYNPGGPGGMLWAQMDCMLGKVLGFAIGNNGSGVNMALAASVLGLLGGMAFGGSFGIAVFFAAIGFLISLFMFVLKVAFSYINGFMIAAIYIIISPLFIPLVLTQPTTQFFEKWWKGLVAAMLMPVLVAAYSTIALMVYDRMLLADDSMINQLFDHEIFQRATEDCEPRELFAGDSGNTANIYDAVGVSQESRGMASAAFDSFSTMFGLGGGDICIPETDFGEYSKKGSSDNEVFVELLIEFAQLLILAIIMKQGLENMMKALAQLTGVSSVAAAMSPQKGIEQNIVGGIQNMRQTMMASMSAPITEAERARAQERGEAAPVMGPGGVTGTLFGDRLFGVTQSDGTQSEGAVQRGFQAFVNQLGNRR